jgi:hypothetical protein
MHGMNSFNRTPSSEIMDDSLTSSGLLYTLPEGESYCEAKSPGLSQRCEHLLLEEELILSQNAFYNF